MLSRGAHEAELAARAGIGRSEARAVLGALGDDVAELRRHVDRLALAQVASIKGESPSALDARRALARDAYRRAVVALLEAGAP